MHHITYFDWYGKAQTTNFISRIFPYFLCGALIPFCKLQKGFDTFKRWNKNGEVTLSNNVTYVFAIACYMEQSFTFQNLSENRKKIMKMQKESEFV